MRVIIIVLVAVIHVLLKLVLLKPNWNLLVWREKHVSVIALSPSKKPCQVVLQQVMSEEDQFFQALVNCCFSRR